jgi:hypothetical protein
MEGKPAEPDAAKPLPDKAVKEQPGIAEPVPQNDTSGFEMK